MNDHTRLLFDEYLPRIMQCRLSDLVLETPVQGMPALSERLGVKVLIKREDLQPVFSFKIRGAYAKLQTLTKQDRQRGIICASAGNHAQGVAMAARHMGIDAIVAPPLSFTVMISKPPAKKRWNWPGKTGGSSFTLMTIRM